MLPNHSCNYGSGPYAEHFTETVLNLESGSSENAVLQFKDISYLELWQPVLTRSEPFVQFW